MIALEHCLGQGARLAVELRVTHRQHAHCRIQMREDAVAHLGSRLTSKRDRQHLLWHSNLRISEQLQEALNQQAGLARACGCFDDERSPDVQRLMASRSIGRVGRAVEQREEEQLSQGSPP